VTRPHEVLLLLAYGYLVSPLIGLLVGRPGRTPESAPAE
jgi:hypothetical protein